MTQTITTLSPAVWLASTSPRRRELLRQIGVRFDVLSVAVDETPHPGEDPGQYVMRMASAKAQAGFDALVDDSSADGNLKADTVVPVLGADTAVVLDDMILGKPTDAAEARAQLALLSGRGHEVYCSVALANPIPTAVCVTSQVWFKALGEDEISDYVATQESMDKAGSYAIQGYAAAFITRLEGSYSAVMGLPLFETSELLRARGVELFGSA